jgi:hypothetical protein
LKFPKRSTLRRRPALFAAVLALAVSGLGMASGSALAYSTVYGEGWWVEYKGPKYGWVDVVRAQSEGRTGYWSMNTYLSNGETDPGMGTHKQYKGKYTEYYSGEYPPNQATSQTWVAESKTGWLWAWTEWD